MKAHRNVDSVPAAGVVRMHVHQAIVLLLLINLACAGVAPPDRLTTPPAAGDRPAPLAFERVIAPFPVIDHDGTELPYPFFGGFNNPRPQLVDLTGDGRIDLAVQEDLDRIIVFANTGDERHRFDWRTDHWHGIDVGTWFRFGDLTGNGELDLIAQRLSGQVRFYRNDGTTEEPRYTLAADPLLDTAGDPLRAEDPNVPALADIDGDGRLDLFMGQVDRGHIRYYRHTGVRDGIPQYELVTHRFQNIEIYEPSPTCDPGFVPEIPPIPESPDGMGRARLAGPDERPTRLHGENALTFADIDDDGRLDLFWGDFFTPSLYYFRNDGTRREPQFTFVSPRFPLDDPLTTSGYNVPSFGDVDGAGTLDLVLGIVGGFCSSTANLIDNLYLLRNTGTPAEPNFIEETGRLIRGIDVGRVSIPAFADLTGNGLPDLVVGSAYNPLPDGPRRGSLFLFRNTGSPGQPRFEIADVDFLALDLDFANHYAPAFVDLDGDGRLDLVVGTFGGRLFWLRNVGASGDLAFGEPQPLTTPDGRRIDVGQTAIPTFGDLTGNGLPDLVVGSFRGTLHYYRNVGTPDQPVFELETNTFLDLQAGRSTAPHLADVTGDGRLDLLIGTEHRGLLVFLNDGNGGFQEAESINAGRAQLAPAAADLTGNGRLDLVVGTRSGGLLYLEHRSPSLER